MIENINGGTWDAHDVLTVITAPCGYFWVYGHIGGNKLIAPAIPQKSSTRSYRQYENQYLVAHDGNVYVVGVCT